MNFFIGGTFFLIFLLNIARFSCSRRAVRRPFLTHSERWPLIVLRPGAVFEGRYTLLNLLGEGAYSEVWSASHEMLGRQAALKVMRDNLARNPRLVDRFLREAGILARMNHPNIVRVYDAGKVEGQPWFAMEYVAGRDLHKVLCDQPDYRFAPLDTALIVEAILEGLIATHSEGIFHLDLKPDNVLMGEDGVIRIFDFGIALVNETEATPRLTREGTMGTPGYMAPEIQHSRLTAGATTDLYAVGAMLYVFCGGSLEDAKHDVIDLSRVEAREGYLAALRGEYAPLLPVIRRATLFQQEGRYASADEMLGAVRAARRVIERSQPAPSGLVRTPGRRPTPAPPVMPEPEIRPGSLSGSAALGSSSTAVPPERSAEPEPERMRPAVRSPVPEEPDPFVTTYPSDLSRRPQWSPPWGTLGVCALVMIAMSVAIWRFWSSSSDETPVAEVVAEQTVEPIDSPVPVDSPVVEDSPVPLASVEEIYVPPEIQEEPIKVETSPPTVKEPKRKPDPPPSVTTTASFIHVPMAGCSATRIEAKAPAGSTVKIRYRPVTTDGSPPIWQDWKPLREESPGAFALSFGCGGDRSAGYDYYVEATLPDGSKQKSGSVSAPHKVRP